MYTTTDSILFIIVNVLIQSFQFNTALRWCFLYHVFGIYWTFTFLLALVEMSTAMAVSVWYFNFASTDITTKTTHQRIYQSCDTADPVGFAIVSTTTYHLGTVAFSALVVAPVRYLRSAFMSFQAYLYPRLDGDDDSHYDYPREGHEIDDAYDRAGGIMVSLCSTLCCVRKSRDIRSIYMHICVQLETDDDILFTGY